MPPVVVFRFPELIIIGTVTDHIHTSIRSSSHYSRTQPTTQGLPVYPLREIVVYTVLPIWLTRRYHLRIRSWSYPVSQRLRVAAVQSVAHAICRILTLGHASYCESLHSGILGIRGGQQHRACVKTKVALLLCKGVFALRCAWKRGRFVPTYRHSPSPFRLTCLLYAYRVYIIG